MLLIFDVEALEPRWHHIAGIPPIPAEQRPRPLPDTLPWKPPGTVYSLEWDRRFPLLLLFLSFLVFYNKALSDAVSATALTGRLNAAATTATLGDELNAASQRESERSGNATACQER